MRKWIVNTNPCGALARRHSALAWSLLAVTLLASVVQIAGAQELFYESEPNDTPEGFNPISGEVILAGAMVGIDQDGFAWTVSDADAEKRWTIRLDGIPGELTILQVFRLEFADNGADVTAKRKLFGMGSRDGAKPVFERDLLFEPGEYILGFAHAGGGGDGGAFRPPVASLEFSDGQAGASATADVEVGGYRAAITASRPVNASAPSKPADTREAASELRPAGFSAQFITTQTSWHRLELDEQRAASLWELRGQLPVGHAAEVFLRDEAGTEVASMKVDDFGRFVFTDLGLGAGAHFIEIQGKQANTIRIVESAVVGQRTEGAEAEENGAWKVANRVDLTAPVSGRLSPNGDSDYFRFTIDEGQAETTLELSLETEAGQAIQLCLLDAEGNMVQCRKDPGHVSLPKLALTPGVWGALVARGPEDAAYSLRLGQGGSIVPGEEYEPNDDVFGAVSVPPKNRIKGRFDTNGDVDYYRFLVTDEAQLWRFQAVGDGLQRIVYYDGAGKNAQEFRDTSRRLRLDNVFLMPGQHFIALHGKPDSEYTLLARPLGPPDPDGEREPNDSVAQMQTIEIGQRRNGLAASNGDLDLYRFTLFDWERIRVTIAPPADGAVRVHFYWEYPGYFARENSGLGEPVIYEGLFPPGPYVISIAPHKLSDAEYHVEVERLDRFGCPTDCEPNGDQAFARPVPPSMVIEGSNAGWDGDDFYALPVQDTPRKLVIRADEKYRLSVTAGNERENLVNWDDTLGAFQGTLPADLLTYLKIGNASNGYRLALEWAGGPAPLLDAAPPPAEIALEVETDTVKAYRRYAQQVEGRLRVFNRGSAPLVLALEVATSDRRWRVELGRDSVEVPADGSVDVPVAIQVPRDAWAGRAVRVSVRAANRGGHVATHVDLKADPTADPVGARRGYSLPGPLLGGFNVAEQRLGGRWAGDYTTAVGWSFDQAIDGLAVKNNGMSLRGGYSGENAELKIDLAGESPVEVVGVVVHSLGGSRARRYLRIADVAVSLDGVTWDDVLFAPLDPIDGEQTFVLEQPAQARFVRLMFEYNWSGSRRAGESLGEFKVIAKPGYDISNGSGFNLGKSELGGHVVWARPRVDAGWNSGILDEAGKNDTVRMKAGQSQSWVVSFHHDRAALLDRLEWTHNANPSPQRFKTVAVAASMDSPLGPWKTVGEWTLSADGAVDLFKPEEPFWARYVRFTTNPVDAFTWHAMPSPLRLWEVPTSTDYRSVLTEWGHLSRQAFWESRQPVVPDPPFVLAPNDARERAASLKVGESAAGAVRLAEHEHWYRLDIPADQNTLTITLGGSPTVRTMVHAETGAGERIVLRRIENQSRSNQHVFEGVVEPGATVFLEIAEPPRNVLFTWDTSASVGPYLPVIYNALIEYSRDVKPGLDEVNYMPFGRGVLLREWYGEPYVLQTVLNDYPQRESSSAAETTLANASRALAPRPGTKAIVLMTDAATSAYRGGLWDAFDEARPRIFALGVSSEGAWGRNPYHEQDLMEGWSAVNGGHYSHLLTAGELEVAFDRAQTLLREPAPYTLRVDAQFREAPGPGTLTVVAGDDASGTASAAGGAVELILDASGSMLQRIGGKRRIAIAKEVLTEAVNDWIPDGTPVALRVFGHREPNACRTDLEVPLEPLDRSTVAGKIAGVNAMNLARTPIAASLLAAAGDLSGATGAVSILLLTDGEETCDGDPAAAIAALQERGIDVTLNIVGFAIDDDATESQFAEWAASGGGRYFAATDQAGLAESVNEALKVPFTVYDQDGEQVAEGLVDGDPVILEAGYYRVVVGGAQRRVYDDVEVAGEEDVRIEIR